MTTGDARQLGPLVAAVENEEQPTTTRDDDGTPVGEADHQADIERSSEPQHHHRHDV